MFRLRILAIVLPALGVIMTLVVFGGARNLWANPSASANIPELMSYQGYLSDSGGNPISGAKTITFTIYDADPGGNAVWTETHSAVPVSDGFFSVLLGSAGTPLTPNTFNSDTRYLGVNVDGVSLPRQRLAAVPYALQAYRAAQAVTAATALSSTYALTAAHVLNGDYANVVVVAKSGGDYTSLVDAMNSISPTANNHYLVLVMPGVYNERVEVKEYVYVRGAGMHATRIIAQVEDANINNATAAVLVLPANSQVSDLSVINTGAAQDSAAIYIDNGNNRTELSNVSALAINTGGLRHVGVYLTGGTAKLTQVDARTAGATIGDWAVFTNAASPVIDSSNLAANGSGGGSANGLRLNGGSPLVQNSTISAVNAGAANGIEGSAGTDTIRVDHSTVIGEDVGVFAGTYTAYIGASLLEGGALGATFKCAQSYDENYDELNATCL
jgi:hypothetical protein